MCVYVCVDIWTDERETNVTYVHICRMSLTMSLYFMDGNKRKILYRVNYLI